jgi:hypothetical protein
MTFFSPGDCKVCGIPPLLFVRNSLDGLIVLYCFDCGGVYRAPEGRDLAYGDRPIDVTKLVPIGLEELERAGHGHSARPVRGPVRFP